MKEQITVAFSAAGSLFAPAFSRCLKNNGERDIRVIGLDCSDDATILQYCDEAYKTPKANDAAYVDEVLRICKEREVGVFIPYMSAELMALYERKDEFEHNGTKLSVGSYETILYCTDKLKLYALMREKGLPTPRFYPFNTVEGYMGAVRKVGWPMRPVCVKAVGLSGSRGFRVIDNHKSRFDVFFGEKPSSVYATHDDVLSILSERPNEIPQMMAMEYLAGEEFSVDVLADKGEIIYMSARQSNRIVASIPLQSTLFDDERAYEICRAVARLVSLDGNADFDFRYDDKGTPVLLEVNPRVAATMAIFAEGGVNLPYMRVKQLLGEELPKLAPRNGLVMVRRYQEYYHFT